MKRITLVLLVYILVISSCQKEETSCGVDHHNISENLYPLLFNPESYWIYENQNGIADSVILQYCVADTSDRIKTGVCNSLTEEVYNLDYESSEYGKYSEHFFGYLIRRGSIDGGQIYLSSFRVGDNVGNATIAAIHDSLVIKGKTYNRVVEMEVFKDEYINSDMRLYYVDSIGVIKKILIDDSNDSIIWELTRYNTTLVPK